MQILSMQYYHGRNIYAHRPVLRVDVDMGEYFRRESTEFPELEKQLLTFLPELSDHHCSRRKPGGFLERIREGTYLSHIIEHVLLEIMKQGGQEVVWGKTVYGEIGRKYIIVVDCNVKEAGEKAADVAVKLVHNAVKFEKMDIMPFLQEIKDITSQYGTGPSTNAILLACKKEGIPYLALRDGIFQLGYGKKQKKIFGTLTENISCLACDIAGDKSLTKTMLKDIGLPILPQRLVFSEKEALDAAKKLGLPVAIKPNNGNHGRGVSINLNSVAEIRAAYKLAYMHDKAIILEKYLHGRHYRLLVIGGSLKACAERVPPQVVGDGTKTVKELIQILNKDPRRGDGHANIRTKIIVDAELILTISKQKYSLDDILPDGEVLIMRENPNLSCGAGADDITPYVHPSFTECAEIATKAVGLDIAGLDIVAEDITKSMYDQKSAIIEINASPGLRMHLHPDTGDAQPVGEEIVKMLFPTKMDWHIPVVTITGTNGKTTTTRLIGAMLSKSGESVGMTTTGGIYVKGKCIQYGDTTGPESAKMVLKHPEVTAAVLETARGGILRAGLGYDIADVAVITNISEDHLGQDGIETLEDLAHVKALVAEAVRPNGTVVLNADDEYCMQIKNRLKSSITLFSAKSNNPTLIRHLSEGGEAFFIMRGFLLHAKGDSYQEICSIQDIPIVYNGRALHNVSNVLAAVAAAIALGIASETIASTLKEFGKTPTDNPGRLHIEEIAGATVIIDYGHNLAGYQLTADFARTLTPKRLLAAIAVPGDRNDDSIIKVGAYAGKAFDEIWIKEDADLRGRKSGVVAELLKRGAIQNMKEQSIHLCLHETTAVKQALSHLNSGDVLLVFYEKFDPVITAVRETQNLKMVVQV